MSAINRPVKSGWPRNAAPDLLRAHVPMLGKQTSTDSNCTMIFFSKVQSAKLGRG